MNFDGRPVRPVRPVRPPDRHGITVRHRCGNRVQNGRQSGRTGRRTAARCTGRQRASTGRTGRSGTRQGAPWRPLWRVLAPLRDVELDRREWIKLWGSKGA